MGTIKYISETKRIWEFDGEDWYWKGIEVPYATFYEDGEDAKKLREINEKGAERKILLHNENDPGGLCPKGYIYFPITIDGEKEIVRTKTLTRITKED